MQNGGITIGEGVKTGHLIRQAEAFRDACNLLINRLEEIPETYCERDGGELVVVSADRMTIIKRCPKCGERYGFPTDEAVR